MAHITVKITVTPRYFMQFKNKQTGVLIYTSIIMMLDSELLLRLDIFLVSSDHMFKCGLTACEKVMLLK